MMLSFQDGDVVIVFRDIAEKAHYDGLSFEDVEKEAYAFMANMRIGLNDNKDKLTLNHLEILKNAAFEKFNSLGTSPRVALAILSVFNSIKEMADKKVN